MGEAILGGNISQVDGDEVYGFKKLGINAGAGAIVPLGDHFTLGIEVLLNQKGSRQKAQSNDSIITGEYKLRLNYLEVPVLFHYNDKDRAWFGAGFSWGRLASIEEYEHGQKITTTSLDGPYDRDDINFLLDVKFRMYKSLLFNVRYAYSLKKIRTREFDSYYGNDTWTRKQYNNLWSFRLIYVFNEDLSKRARREIK